MSCRRRRGYRRFSTSAYRLLGDFEVAITGGVWVATGVLKRVERLALGKPSTNVARAHTRRARRARPTAPPLTQAVLSTYGIKDEKTLLSRRHQESFQAWVYLLRRVANLPLREVAKHGNVSPSRISKIQRAIETRKIAASLQQLLDKCNVKN